MEDRKAWTAKSLFIKLNSLIKPELRVQLTDSEESRISSIQLFTVEFKHLFNLCADDDTIEIVANVLNNLSSKNFDIKEHLLSLLYGKNSGYLYELLTYNWLMKREICFTPQIEVHSTDILSNKSSGTTLDGIFFNWKIYFDIKSFEVPTNIKQAIIDKLSSCFPDFNIMLEGNYDSDYSALAQFTLEKVSVIEKAAKEAFSNSADLGCGKNKTWAYPIPELGISIKFEQIDAKGSIHTAMGTFDPYGWAMNNEVFFLKNVEQYTTKRPFVLICPFKNPPLHTEEGVKIALRSIARRAFVKFHYLQKNDINYDRYNKEAHRKVDTNISLSEITSYLSGILFINIAKESILENGLFFGNSNAKNKVGYTRLEQIFNFEIPHMPDYDDFTYDNY